MGEKEDKKFSLGEELSRRDAIVASSIALTGLYMIGCKAAVRKDDNAELASSRGDGVRAREYKKVAQKNYRESCMDICGKPTLSEQFNKVADKICLREHRVLFPNQSKVKQEIKEKIQDIVIIGSGYGGAVLAARLSEKYKDKENMRITILERGKEWVPGTFPSRGRDLLKEFNTGLNNDGLLNYKADITGDLDIFSACGLGGTSLINAGIAIEPSDEVFKQDRWSFIFKEEVNGERTDVRKKYYDRARKTLGVSKSPLGASSKASFLEQGAEYLRESDEKYKKTSYEKLDITISENSRTNKHGFKMEGCAACGDCFSGCNVGAKGSLETSYLAIARKNGVQMLTSVEVKHIEKHQGDSGVEDVYYDLYVKNPDFVKSELIRAKMVIVSAGTLGTHQILRKSSEKSSRNSSQLDLTFSDKFGKNFSSNGDVVAMGMNLPSRSNSGGPGLDNLNAKTVVGPVVESIIDMRNNTADLKDQTAIVDASIPSPLSRSIQDVEDVLSKMSKVFNRDIGFNFNSGFTFLALNHDESDGELRAGNNGFADIHWPGFKNKRFLKRSQDQMKEIVVKKWKAIFIPTIRNMSVHPLGGCAISLNKNEGVVNISGQPWVGQISNRTPRENEVHKGLYIADGSVLPGSTGIHPFLTIAAISEKIADNILKDNPFNFFNS